MAPGGRNGAHVADEKMSDGEIRYRFKVIDEKFEDIDERFKEKEQRGEKSWARILAVAGIAVTLIAAIIGAYATTKGIK